MRHRSSANAEPGEAVWASGENKKSLFTAELETGEDGVGMAFEAKLTPKLTEQEVERFGKEDDADSAVSGHSNSRLEKKANLEIVWQKANSINGIRKMNILFKEERRQVTPIDANDQITREYWQICDSFI